MREPVDHKCARCGAKIDMKGRHAVASVREFWPEKVKVKRVFSDTEVLVEKMKSRSLAPAAKLCTECMKGAQDVLDAYCNGDAA